MKKKIALVCVTLLSTSLFGISEADILKKAKKAGQLTGAAVGAGLGAAGGIYLGKKLETKSRKEKLQKDPQIRAGVTGMYGIGGASLGAVSGAYIGRKLVDKASSLYLQKKYSLSKKLASAYLITELSPTDQKIRSLFQYAEEKNKEIISKFLDNYLTEQFGANWLNIIIKSINATLTLKKLNYEVLVAEGRYPFVDVQEKKNALNRQKELINKTMPSFRENVKFLLTGSFLYAIATLYLNDTFFDFAWESNQLPRIKKLIEVLF